EEWLHSCWRRAWVVVDNPIAQTVRIGWRIRGEPMGAPLDPVDFAAPLLEELSPAAAADLMSVVPWFFFPTDDDLSFPIATCEDSFGLSFRADNWQAVCEGPDPTDCYYETSFAIGLPAIEQGEILESGSFATGNFNYRFVDFAVNLVGTGIRDCELTQNRSVCYASAFVPVSLRHGGPY